MRPICVAPISVPRRRRRLTWIALQPGADVIVVELLAPYHAGESLPLHESRIFVGLVLLKLRIILISFADTGSGQIVKVCKWPRLSVSGEPQANLLGSPSRHSQHVVHGGLSAASLGVHRSAVAMHDV